MSICEGCTSTCSDKCHDKCHEVNNPLSRQVGGNHYKDFAIQPVEFVTKNRLGFLPGSVVKRMCRYNKPTGKGLQDLQKAKHEIDLLIELEEWTE